MSKIDMLEMEENENYEEELEEQKALQEEYNAQQKTRDIDAAIKLLQANGFLVTIGG